MSKHKVGVLIWIVCGILWGTIAVERGGFLAWFCVTLSFAATIAHMVAADAEENGNA